MTAGAAARKTYAKKKKQNSFSFKCWNENEELVWSDDSNIQGNIKQSNATNTIKPLAGVCVSQLQKRWTWLCSAKFLPQHGSLQNDLQTVPHRTIYSNVPWCFFRPTPRHSTVTTCMLSERKKWWLYQWKLNSHFFFFFCVIHAFL